MIITALPAIVGGAIAFIKNASGLVFVSIEAACILVPAAVIVVFFRPRRPLPEEYPPSAASEAALGNTRPLIHRIDFDYLPEGSPLGHGWELAKEEIAGTLPKIDALHDEVTPRETIMSIESRGWYALDYPLPHVSVYHGVRFTARIADSGVVYLKLRIWTPERKPREGWLAQLPVGGTIPHGDGSIEWQVSQPKKVLPSGWVLFDLSLPDQVRATFQCPEYQLLGIRVRVSLAISPIDFFGPVTG